MVIPAWGGREGRGDAIPRFFSHMSENVINLIVVVGRGGGVLVVFTPFFAIIEMFPSPPQF